MVPTIWVFHFDILSSVTKTYVSQIKLLRHTSIHSSHVVLVFSTPSHCSISPYGGQVKRHGNVPVYVCTSAHYIYTSGSLYIDDNHLYISFDSLITSSLMSFPQYFLSHANAPSILPEYPENGSKIMYF